MKIKHYPGKAVVNDPAWLEMDIPNSARGKQYESNWEDAQKSLSNHSSTTNSWDKYSYKSMDGTISSRLGQYQSMLDDIKKDNEDIYAIPNKLNNNSGKESLRVKYHSDNCLSRINSKNKKDVEEEMAKYFLPCQSKVQRERSFKTGDRERPKPKPRKKLALTRDNDKEKFKIVIDDLQKHMKKSVRFDEISTEITHTTIDNNYTTADDDDVKEDTSNKVRVISNPLNEIGDNMDNASDSDEIQERVSTWIDDQNKYLISVNENDARKENINLKRNDSGYYEHSGKPRQRLPPKNIYPSSSSSSGESVADECSYANTTSSTDSEFNELYSLYKNGSGPKRKVINSQPKLRDRTKNASPTLRRGVCDSNDFLIPRPKLIVPVHTYAVRKRRTGNILSECYDSDCNSVRDFQTVKPNTGL
ncbi:hypothetical protein NQ315_014507 [Exocentrus adspersus]|uniref:Uncharacterized protein n=1 Tax=Exocentrus adspersus TaxID=1586481 RepID=A0AAV8V9A0_9CUCU|nr:hypothetical protein NQ315_014507 [Exocentrus adspersus]